MTGLLAVSSPARKSSTRGPRQRTDLTRSIEQLRATVIEFIPHPSYESIAAEVEDDLAHLDAPVGSSPPVEVAKSADNEHYLASLYRAPLLSKSEEYQLFRAMNYLKYRANALRTALAARRSTRAQLDRIARLLEHARAIRNRIISSNLRLVISVAKQYADASTSLADLISDGNMSLLRAVEKFDYTRGYRFSTYATWALRYNYNRSLATQRLRRKRFVTGDDTFLADAPDDYDATACTPLAHSQLKRALRKMLDRLDDREQQIIAARFGLDTVAERHTLQAIARNMGVCKERVRQIEIRALGKLRKLAEERHLEIPGAQ